MVHMTLNVYASIHSNNMTGVQKHATKTITNVLTIVNNFLVHGHVHVDRNIQHM